MAGMKEREEAFEKKFARDAELRFKAEARRNKLLGLWAAEKMGIDGDAAQAYAREVIAIDLEEAGEEDVFRKIRADFDKNGVQQTDEEIRTTMTEMLAVAVKQIVGE